MSRKLTKFEDDITGIALRLVKEKIDPQNAGMDILDLINDELEIETIRERAGYEKADLWMQAFMVLKRMLPNATFETLYEVSPDELKAQMAAKADQYLKGRGSELDTATTTRGVTSVDEPEGEPKTDLGKFAQELSGIAERGLSDGSIDHTIIQSLQRIAQELEKYEQTLAGGGGMRFKRLFGGESEDPEIQTLLRHAGVMEEEERNLMTLLNTLKTVMGPIITDLRQLAHWELRGNPEAQEKVKRITDQLASFQWKLHGEREREPSQMWTDVERQKPAY
jgi:hypothetical protein